MPEGDNGEIQRVIGGRGVIKHQDDVEGDRLNRQLLRRYK